MVRIGSAWQEITEIARDRDIDLIIIGTHGYTGLKHLVLGSTAEKVVRHAPCPVLTVREKEHEFVDA
jgi:nucleotide-binding universal stress UspA family protein